MNVILPDDKPACAVLVAAQAALRKISGNDYATCSIAI